eukprot:5439287-Alexandrium_andersonii.AAC.1
MTRLRQDRPQEKGSPDCGDQLRHEGRRRAGRTRTMRQQSEQARGPARTSRRPPSQRGDQEWTAAR